MMRSESQQDSQARLDGSACHEMVVIIRPSFKKLCEQDACRAALLNHLLYWIARRAKGQEEDAIKRGEVYWYGSAQDIWAGLDQSWSIWKVRNELKALVSTGLIGQRHNPAKGWDREYQYFFGEEQGQVFRAACQEHHICLCHLGLSIDVLHLLKTVNAFDENRKCICGIHQMHLLNSSDAFTENSRAIPKVMTKITAKETTKVSPKGENDIYPEDSTSVAAHTPPPSSDGVEGSQMVSTPETAQGQQTSNSQHPVPPVTTPPTSENTSDKASDQRKQNGTTGKASEKPKTSRSSSTTPSSGASLLLDAWDQINGRPLTRTKEQVQAAEELARINATKDDLQNVQERLLSQKDGFWKARGVSLKNVANNFHLAALGPLRPLDGTKAAPPVQSAVASARPPVDTSQSRKLLRRVPSATQGEFPNTSKEARKVL